METNSGSIKYNVIYKSNINLTLYDSFGGEVKSFINGVQNPGLYEIKMNDDNIRSGVYFCRIYHGDNFETKRVLYIRENPNKTT
jgi:hypothetical protein